jgi:hypothetical protein
MYDMCELCWFYLIKIEKYRLYLVGVQEVKWEITGTKQAEDFSVFSVRK